jgi:uncharacterized protein YeaO (DUF488 family)
LAQNGRVTTDGRAGTVRAARVYDPPGPGDGTRVLVDRLWPRGLSKTAAAFDEWLPAVAPTTELRRWYSHDPARFDEFATRYRAELAQPEPAAALTSLRALRRRGPVTLLTATKALDRSHAAVLAAVLAAGVGDGD